eukprot:COSAG01_NODE_71753_length_255_cov_0.525641_1_plen_84_part_11
MFSSNDYRLIHAIVERRSDGKKHIHSFILDTKTNTIIDKSNGLDLELPKQLAFALGNIEHYVEYNLNAMLKHLIQYKHYGPWDT